MKLSGKIAILTGASSGIGQELLKLLLAAGVNVVAASRSMEQSGFDHRLLLKKNCDVSSSDSIDELFAFTLQKLGTPDLFIANAGFAYFEKLGDPDWEHINKIFATNVFSLCYCAQKMKSINNKDPFNFVCTASGISFISIPGYALYSSTKAAIRGFADAYRFELKKGQYFQVVFPVATRTSFFQVAGEETPVPWPVQSAEEVAESIIRGIESNRHEIYPSRLFRAMLVLNRFIPVIAPIYTRNENRKFQLWLKNRSTQAEKDQPFSPNKTA